jgi:ABC-type sugar transport system substrate-binding protein
MLKETVAFFMHDSQNDYQANLRRDFEAAARRHGLDTHVVSADANPEKQARQVDDLLSRKDLSLRLILVSAVREATLLPLAQAAVARRIGWCFLSRWHNAITGLRQQYPSVSIFSSSPDQEEIGAAQGRQLRIALRPDDELVYIQGPLGTSSARARTSGTGKVLLGLPGLRRANYHGDWSFDSGHQLMGSWLSSFSNGNLPNFVIGAHNDAMAMGAHRAVGEWMAKSGRKLPPLRCFGVDGSEEFGKRYIRSGELTGTIIVPTVSGQAVDAAVTAKLRGAPVPERLLVPVEAFPDESALKRALGGESNTSLPFNRPLPSPAPKDNERFRSPRKFASYRPANDGSSTRRTLSERIRVLRKTIEDRG